VVETRSHCLTDAYAGLSDFVIDRICVNNLL